MVNVLLGYRGCQGIMPIGDDNALDEIVEAPISFC